MSRLNCLCAVIVLAVAQVAYPAIDTETTTAWEQVRSGDAVVLMRHALAPGVGDPAEFTLTDCSTQRNLSTTGRAQAEAIGDVLRSNGIVQATVHSSLWCRCLETAELLRLGSPEPMELLNSFYEDRSTADTQNQGLQALLKRWLSGDAGINILVTHQVNISALTGEFAGSGDMLIVALDNNDVRVLAHISTQ